MNGNTENMKSTPSRFGPQLVGIGAMALAVVAAIAIGRPQTPAPAHAMASDWLADIETGFDHIAAEDLMSELLAVRNDVVVVDVRPPAEFAAWHLPSAQNLSVPEVCGDAGRALFAKKPRLVVLCSNGTTHPAQAWVQLRAAGHDNVRVLDGGLDAFKEALLLPPSLRPEANETSAKQGLASWPLVRAFFLGKGTTAPSSPWATDPAKLTQPTMVSPQWLHQNLGGVAVLDLRPERDFLALHIPGAQRLDLAKIRQKHGDRDLHLVANDQLATWFGNLGIGNDTSVVLYADDKQQDPTLAALALLRLGHRSLAILEGGILRWATERRPLTAALTMPKAQTYTPRPAADDFTVTTDQVAAAVAAGATKVLDVRPPEFFRGEKTTEARAGHIPGSTNRLFSRDLVRTDDGQWLRPRTELEQDYLGLGLQPNDPVVVSCRTGHTASHSYFVLRHLLGYQNVKWYAGSWTEWAERKDLPAAMGDK